MLTEEQHRGQKGDYWQKQRLCIHLKLVCLEDTAWVSCCAKVCRSNEGGEYAGNGCEEAEDVLQAGKCAVHAGQWGAAPAGHDWLAG